MRAKVPPSENGFSKESLTVKGFPPSSARLQKNRVKMSLEAKMLRCSDLKAEGNNVMGSNRHQ